MNDNERDLFDLQGYITVENALTTAQLAELNRILDEHIANERDGDMCTHRFGGLLDWGEAYRDLIDNGPVVPYLTEIVDPKFRLDHVYADIIRSGTSPIGATLHGGSFSDGRMHKGLTVVAYNLADVGPEDGGFGCVPGSHKSNYSLPGQWRNMEEGLQPCVRRVTGAADSAIVFTEALSHGALPWSGAGERRTVFFKYSPHPLSWAAGYYDDKVYDGLSQGQRDILEAPNARYGNRPR